MSSPLTEPARITFAGDWHGAGLLAEIALSAAADHGSTVVLQVGDFGLRAGIHGDRYLDRVEETCAQLGLWCLVVPGNHENYDLLEAAPRTDDGLLLLRQHVLAFPRGYRWTWHGIRFLALGGAVSIDQELLTEGENWWPAEEITPNEVAYAIAGGPADVVVAHDCPAGVTIPGIGDGMELHTPADIPHTERRRILNRSLEHRHLLRAVACATRPAVWVHGHYHLRYTGRLDLTDGGHTSVTGLHRETSPQENVLHVDLATLAGEIRQTR